MTLTKEWHFLEQTAFSGRTTKPNHKFSKIGDDGVADEASITCLPLRKDPDIMAAQVATIRSVKMDKQSIANLNQHRLYRYVVD